MSCEQTDIYPELYKLLLYEKGQHFVSHRDTEKLPGMFATLVIMLPSSYEGGILVVRHQGQEKCIDLSSQNAFKICFAAFYADCLHELLPVTKGYRLCLIYNLVYRGQGLMPAPATDTEKIVARLLDAIRAWEADQKGGPRKLAYALEHRYTPAGLSFRGLKSGDRAVVQIMRQVCQKTQLNLHLAIVTRTETGGALGDETGDYYDMEVDERETTIDSWVSIDDDDSSTLPSMTIDEEHEMIPSQPFKGREPDDESVEEATGNEGATMERQYHVTVLVFWPRNRHFHVICEASLTLAIHELENWKGSDMEKYELAQAIVSQSKSKYVSEDGACLLFSILSTLEDKSLLQSFIRDSAAKYCRYDAFRKELIGILPSYKSVMIQLFRIVSVHDGIRLLHDLVNTGALTVEPIPEEVTVALVERFLTTDAYLDHRETINMLRLLIQVLFDLGSDKLLAHLTGALLAPSQRFPMEAVIIPMLLTIPSRIVSSELVQHLIQGAITYLKEHTLPLSEPHNWSLRSDDKRCVCADCQDFQVFLRHPTQTIWQFRAPTHRRQHLEHRLQSEHLDVDFTTVKQGIPHTLELRKNRRSHEKAKEKRRELLVTCDQLEHLLKRGKKVKLEDGHEEQGKRVKEDRSGN